MKVQLKRIGAMIIAIIMVVSLIPLNISAEESQVLEISDFSIKINEEGINLVAISEGGVGNYQYQFYQKQKSSLEDKIILSEYSDKNSYTYANPLQGEYIFGVEVKDESGRSVSEEKNITYENEIEKVEEEISEELIFPNEGLTDNSMEDALEQAGIAMIFSTARQNMYNIEGNPRVTVNDMVNLYNAHSPIGYPSTELEKGGAPTVDTLAQIFYEEAVAENIRPEVAWSQTMLETGWLKFGGQVQIHQFNFAGLGATDGGAKGADFSGYGAEAARMGVRAQIQHLKAYASSSVTEGTLKNPCVDGRFHLVRKGAAPYVEILGQKENPLGVGWATGENYGYKILSIINSMVDVYNTPLEVQLDVSKNTPQVYGTNITIRAIASGGSGKYQYKFYKNNEVTGGIFVLQDYSDNNSIIWNGMPEGMHTLYVDVKEIVTGEIVTKQMNFEIVSKELRATLYTSKESPQTYGTNVTLTVTASGGSGSYEYKFYKNNEVTGGLWVMQDYSAKNSVVWNGMPAGEHTLYVDVKDELTGKIETVKKTFIITDLEAEFKTSKPSPQVYRTDIVLGATASGGSGNYEYKFYKNNEVTGGIYILQNYSTKSNVSWNAIPEGLHTLYVDVRDKTTGRVVTKQKEFVVNPSPTPLVKKFDTNVPSPQKYGTPITITAEGVGGTGGYQYRFYKNNEVTGGIYVIQDYSEKNSVMWNGIPEGTHTLYVDIKDSSGQTVTESKTFVISNKKKIWIDAGHGGNDVGAVAHGRYERDDVLRLALEIERVLRQQGQEVYMSRRDVDSGYISSGLVSLRKRCADANVARVDAFVSVHRDAASASAKGYTVYTHNWNNPSNSIVNPYPNKDSGCVSLSNSINSELSKLSTLKSRGIKYGSAGGTDDYLVNKATNMPSCLLEMGFITNSGDNQLFDTYLKQHAKAISKGIMNSLGVTFDESKYTW